MIAARDLYIAWSDIPQYWRWISLPESRFPEVAELLNACWFHVRGSISTKMLSSGTCYVAYLVFARKSGVDKFDLPAEAFVELNGHESERQRVFLGRERGHRSFYRRLPRLVRQKQTVEDSVAESNAKYPKPRSDGWIEVELGEYFVEGREDDDLELGLIEYNDYYGKSRLIVQGIELRPKAVSR
ncbi:Putative F-box protein PP2-B2 [Striga hermonthica]|uniref:F-box protein PP2-B2 n=1 Tax=Striga hermonthica TaxID=68872 RepID=A0A9N7R8Q5_STRHE|nr:Putative F-box protein PP2-B2 [Striga hermonthica]